MRKLTILFVSLLTCFSLYAQPGTIDPSFGTTGGIEGTAIDIDNKLMVVGTFTKFDGVVRARIARLFEDGSLDLSFRIPSDGSFDNAVLTVAIQPDGKILAAGMFTKISIIPDVIPQRLIRMNSDGSMDTAFNKNLGTGFTTLNLSVSTLALQSDGKIIVGGMFTLFNGQTQNRILRLNADGTLDATFNTGTGFDNNVKSLTVQPDGKILVGGGYAGGAADAFTSYNGNPCGLIARLNTDGSFDKTFNPGGAGFNTKYAIVNCMQVQQDSKIVVGGVFTTYNGTSANGIIRLNPDGSIDPTFNIGTGFQGQNSKAVVLQENGKIVVGGLFNSFNGDTVRTVTRLNADGTLDKSFITGNGFGKLTGGGYVGALHIQDDGKIVVGGKFKSYNDTLRNFIMRLNGDDNIKTNPVILSEKCTAPNVAITFKGNAKFDNSNVFTAQLSDKNGSFSTPLVIGTLAGAMVATINTVIPPEVASGNAYRVRVVSSSPVVIGDDNGTDLTINHIEKAIINIDGYKLGTINKYDTYQWLLEGKVIPKATDSTYIVSKNGNYTVVVSDTATGCVDTSDIYKVTNVKVGIDEANGLNDLIKVYPNPAYDVVYIQAPEKVNLTIMGIDGKILSQEQDAHQVILSGWATGIYFLRISGEDGRLLSVKKIVKSK